MFIFLRFIRWVLALITGEFYGWKRKNDLLTINEAVWPSNIDNGIAFKQNYPGSGVN